MYVKKGVKFVLIIHMDGDVKISTLKQSLILWSHISPTYFSEKYPRDFSVKLMMKPFLSWSSWIKDINIILWAVNLSVSHQRNKIISTFYYITKSEPSFKFSTSWPCFSYPLWLSSVSLNLCLAGSCLVNLPLCLCLVVVGLWIPVPNKRLSLYLLNYTDIVT